MKTGISHAVEILFTSAFFKVKKAEVNNTLTGQYQSSSGLLGKIYT